MIGLFYRLSFVSEIVEWNPIPPFEEKLFQKCFLFCFRSIEEHFSIEGLHIATTDDVSKVTF